ncbi:MAG: hypothetical protein H6721_29570 [Sandaracinus sp.]|nr:hypothetical protein [Sandaracinus sp.]MCB9615523.1 hypothetical protein [Sandaracinus sp.]MCB9636281.1 hypothetical protein [Sandaracinus sp.]
MKKRSISVLRWLSVACLLGVVAPAAAQPAAAPMGVSAMPGTQSSRVWASTLYGDLASWEPSGGWVTHVRGGVLGGVGAITFAPGVSSTHREQAFYVRDGQVRSLPVFDGVASSEITLPGWGSASFANSAVAATTYGAVGIAVAALSTNGSMCTWNGSIFGFPTAPTCVSGADKSSALVGATMSFNGDTYVSFYYRSAAGNLMRREERIASGDFRWRTTELARGVGRAIAVTPKSSASETIAYLAAGRVRVADLSPTAGLRSIVSMPATSSPVADHRLGLAAGYGWGPSPTSWGSTQTICTTAITASTQAGPVTTYAFTTVPSASCQTLPRPTSSSRWTAVVSMPSGVSWGGASLVLPGRWFGQSVSTLGVGLRAFGSWWLPSELVEVNDGRVILHGRP